MTTKISDEAVAAVARSLCCGAPRCSARLHGGSCEAIARFGFHTRNTLNAAFDHYAAHPEQLPEGFYYAPEEKAE